MDDPHPSEPDELLDRLYAYTLYLVPALYLLSLCLSCIYTSDDKVWRGWQILLWGWLGAFGVGTDPTLFAWFANPLLAVTFVLFYNQRFRPAFIAGVPCLLLALSSFQLRRISASVDIDYSVTGYGPGFFCWLGSCAIPVVLSILFYCIAKKAK
jgi:hypothetical protein